MAAIRQDQRLTSRSIYNVSSSVSFGVSFSVRFSFNHNALSACKLQQHPATLTTVQPTGSTSDDKRQQQRHSAGRSYSGDNSFKTAMTN
jgi:hypothetical protein